MAEDVADGLKKINPPSANLDFLAAILGGDERMGHKVIYLEGEMQWYYLDQPSGAAPIWRTQVKNDNKKK